MFQFGLNDRQQHKYSTFTSINAEIPVTMITEVVDQEAMMESDMLIAVD
jgi:hypothetical protein